MNRSKTNSQDKDPRSETREAAPEVRKKPRLRVVFHNQEGDGGEEQIFISLNGRAYLVGREQEVALPTEVLDVIRTAEVEEYVDGRETPVKRKRFSYTVLGEAS